jgi:NitT/TauT family transport system ATP-binding protein
MVENSEKEETGAAVEFRSVTKIFVQRKGKEFVAVSDLNLVIQQKEIYCLLGPSGCGKTTALNMLAGFEPASEGKIIHEGKPVIGPGADRAVIFQTDDALYPWLTATDNVAFGLKLKGIKKSERHETAKQYLELVGLRGQGHKYPRELSGGMKQRVQIARVLVNEPTTLLMDEPFAALDAQTRKRMQEELVRIWELQDKNGLFITHDISEALVVGDRIGVMRSGPASNIREEISVDLPRPRDRTDPKLIEYYRYLNRLVEEEVEQARKATVE